MEIATFALPQIVPLLLFYFIFRDNAAVYGRFTSSQRLVSLAGLVLYVTGLCGYALARGFWVA